MSRRHLTVVCTVIATLAFAACSARTTPMLPATALQGATSQVSPSSDSPLATGGTVRKIAWGTVPAASAGTAFSSPKALSIIAQTASGKKIIGTYANPIVLADSDSTGATQLLVNGKPASAKNPIRKSTDKVTLKYTGLAIVPASFTASAKGAKSAKKVFAPALSQIVYTGPSSDGNPAIVLTTSNPSVTITLSESGWSNSPYNKSFNVSGTCAFATITASSNTSYKVAMTSSPSPGSCQITVTDFTGGHSLQGSVASVVPQEIFVGNEVGAVVGLPPGCATASCLVSVGGGGFVQPFGVAADQSGNLYVADGGGGAGGSVYQVPQSCAAPNCIKSLGGGFTSVNGVAVDSSGNVFAAQWNNVSGSIVEIPVGCTTPACVVTILGSLVEPAALAVDKSDTVYFTDEGNHWVAKIRAGSTSVTLYGEPNWGNWSLPEGIALDRAGNVYVTDGSYNGVTEIPAGCFFPTCYQYLGGGFSYPYGVAVDSYGQVYVTNWSNPQSVSVMPSGCGSSSCVVTLYASSFGGPAVYGTAIAQPSFPYVKTRLHKR